MFGTRKLGRTSDQRKAMLRAMTTYLFENGKIETTFTRAKEVQPVAEKMITLGKKNTLASYRRALAYITKEDVCSAMNFDTIAGISDLFAFPVIMSAAETSRTASSGYACG